MERPGDLRPGRRLGPYTLQERIGTGASAGVYVATDDLGRTFAVKVRRSGQSAMDRRFLREFESMRLLRVPGVVPVHEAGIEDEILWFSMDLVEGRPFLADLEEVQDVGERVARTLELGARLCDVLAALHEAGFVHRDVKPSNVLVDDQGAVHVLDFGIGRYFNDTDTLSHTGEVMGTVPFMAPEQLSGLPTDASVDIFATGLMLHEAIAGKRPRPLTTVAWIPRTCLERLPPLATLFREVPLELSATVEQMLAVEPGDRPSAREAAARLRDAAAGERGTVWPEPLFMDPGDWWHAPSEGLLGGPDQPAAWVFEGPSGSGRRRIAEQIQRTGLLQGSWTIHLRCRRDRLGGPIQQLLEILVTHLDEEQLAEIVGDHTAALRQIWPHLPLPRGETPEGPVPSTGVLIEAVAEVAERLGQRRHVLLVLHDLEQIDAFTARALTALCALAGPQLGVLMLHERRWATRRSSRLVETLVAQGAGCVEVPPLSASSASAVAASLCPAAPPTFTDSCSAQYAVEKGWAALAAWRGERFEPPSPALWPVSVGVDEIPLPVFRALAGRRGEQTPWIRRTDRGVTLAGASARAMARSRLVGLRKSAGTLARAWLQTLGQATRSSDLATLWLLAGEDARAWEPVAKAATEADRRGQYADARRWLLLLETLPPPRSSDPSLIFEVALAKARVALRTDALVLRTELVDGAEGLARTPEQEQAVRTVRAEYDLRAGVVRPALVAALRLGSSGASPRVIVRALLVAVHCRVVLGQIADAERELSRAEAVLEKHPDPVLEVQAGNWRSEIAFLRHDLASCRALCQAQIRKAGQLGYVRGMAFAASRLGQVLRHLGRRREAEHQTRTAREAFAATGDVYLDADSGVALATLLVERGEALGARQILDGAIRRIRALHLDHLLPAATRVALQVATLRGDVTDAAVALSALDERAMQEPETPAALVRWWRTRGDIERALHVPGPAKGSWGHVLWQLERARAAIVGGRADVALTEIREASRPATAMGFRELLLYAEVLRGAIEPVDDVSWSATMRAASSSLYLEVTLGALDMDARRRHALGDTEAARARWRALQARSEELGYRPGVEEASGWLREIGQ